MLGLPPAFVLSQDQTLKFMANQPNAQRHKANGQQQIRHNPAAPKPRRKTTAADRDQAGARLKLYAMRNLREHKILKNTHEGADI